MSTTLGCVTCGHISCVCHIKAAHHPDCKFAVSATCAVGIECEHGRDVCPICDPCTCEALSDGSYSQDGLAPGTQKGPSNV